MGETALGFSTLVGIVIAVGVALGGFLISDTMKMAAATSMIAIIVSVQVPFGFYLSWLRSHHRWTVVGLTTGLDGLAYLLAAALAVPLGLLGFIGALTAARIGLWGGLRRLRPRVRLIMPDWDRLKGLITVGFPLMLVTLGTVLVATVDRILILSFLGEQDLAFYSLGALFFSPVLMFITAGRQVIYPSIGETYGATRSDQDLHERTTSTLWVVSVGASILTALLLYNLGWLTGGLLPAYNQGVAAGRLLIVALLVYGLSEVVGLALNIKNRQRARIILIIPTVLLNAFGGFLAIQRGFGIEGVAAATLGASTFYLIATIWLANRLLTTAWSSKSALWAAGLILPVVCAAIAFALTVIIEPTAIESAAKGTGVIVLLAILMVVPTYQRYFGDSGD